MWISLRAVPILVRFQSVIADAEDRGDLQAVVGFFSLAIHVTVGDVVEVVVNGH